MKNILKLALLLLPMTVLAQAPQVPLTGNIGSGFNGPLINSPAVIFATDADHTMVYPEMSGSGGVVLITSSVTLTATRNLIVPNTGNFNWDFQNNTTGGQTINIKIAGSTPVPLPNGQTYHFVCNTVNCVAPGAGGTVTAVTGTAPVNCTTTGSSVNCLMAQATSSVDGYLSHIDWATFNGKQNALGLIAGTFTNGDMCTYASSGTLLNCNTAIPTVGTWGALNYPTWSSGTPFVKMTAAGTFSLDTNTYMPTTGGTFTGGISAPSVTASGLTSGNCVQVTTGGLLTTASGPCGTSSGTLTATGSPVSGQIAQFSSPTSLTTATSANIQSAIGSGVYDASGAAAARAAVGSCTSGQYGTATTTSGLTCAQVAYSQISGTPTIGTWGALNYPTWSSGTPFVKMTASGTFALDTNTYLTSSGVSGMTAGQIPVAATATTITSSKALAGGGAGITTGPTSSTNGDLTSFTGTAGQAADSGIAASNVPLLNAANTFTAAQTLSSGISMTGPGAPNIADSLGLDNYLGDSRSYSHGSDTSTQGSYDFHTASSDGSIDNIQMQITSSGVTVSEPFVIDYSSTSSTYTEIYNATGHAWLLNSTGSSGHAGAPADSLSFQDATGLSTPLYLTSSSVVALQPVSMPTGSTVNSKNICLADGTNCPSGTLFLGNSSWTIAPTLFATSTMLGAVHYTPYVNAVDPTITVRTSGTISCTVAPVLQLMDLGTTPSTVYASATSILSVTTSTSDGVFTATGSSVLQNNHYYGIAFSAGTCATAPTFDASVSAVW